MPNYGPNQQTAAVTVEYDCRGQRKTKTFDNVYAAKSFYVSKMKDGRNPKITSAQRT